MSSEFIIWAITLFYIAGFALAMYMYEKKLRKIFPELLQYAYISPIIVFIAAGSWITVAIIAIKKNQ